MTLSLSLNDDPSVASLGQLIEGARTVVHAQALMFVESQTKCGPKVAD